MKTFNSSSMKTILIMAAGNGSRYGTLKQFDEMGPNKEFLFEYTIFDAIRNGFEHVVMVTKKEHVETLSDYLRSRLPKNVRLDVVPQEITDLPEGVQAGGNRNKPWGTAHAVWVARNFIDNGFVVANADDYYGRESMHLASKFIDSNKEAIQFASIPYKLSDTLSSEGSVTRAICQAEGSFLKTITEVKEILKEGETIIDKETSRVFSGQEVTSMNLWVFGPEVFSLLEKDLLEFVNSPKTGNNDEIYIPKQVQHWIQDGQVRVLLTGAGKGWFGVTYANDKQRAMEHLVERTRLMDYPAPLWKS
jgi:UTP-glucose-1-phosphate uridylyltransferase